MDDYLERPLREFLEATANKSPTPGGGSVAALAGALACALLEMVVRYALANPRLGEHHAVLGPLREQFGRARGMFAALMREDMAAYEMYAESRRREREGSEAGGKRAGGDPAASGDAAEAARLAAIAVPTEMAVLASTVAGWAQEAAPRVGKSLRCDLAGAVALLEGVARAAASITQANLAGGGEGEGEQAFRRRIEEQIKRSLSRVESVRGAVAGGGGD